MAEDQSKKLRQISVLLPSTLVDEVVRSLRSLAGFNEASATSVYEALRGRIRSGVIIIYNSGSVVYDSSLEEVRRTIENVLYEYYQEEGVIVGSDEAGKGEALGPLVVAAVALNPKQAAHLQSIGVADSKIFPENRIAELAKQIKMNSLAHSVLKIPPSKLNKMFRMKSRYGNLNDILTMGHSRVLKNVVSKISKTPFRIVVDKFDSSKGEKRVKTMEEYLGRVRIHAIVGGEAFPAVAAASILARNNYLTWIRRNLSTEMLEKIRKEGYNVIGVRERPLYFKICYLRK